MRAFAAALALLVAAGAAFASEDEAAAAMSRMIASQNAVLDTLEDIDDAASLERNRERLMAALAKARADTDAMADHAPTFAEHPGLRSDFTPRLEAYNARRDAVYAEIDGRLDGETLDRLEEIFDAAD